MVVYGGDGALPGTERHCRVCGQRGVLPLGGLPAFDIVGLPDAAVREARERVRAAVKNCGAKFPVSRITVNLAPAGQKKAGTVYDLPIFVGLLAAGRELPPPAQQAAFIGELSLTGALRGVTGRAAHGPGQPGTPV